MSAAMQAKIEAKPTPAHFAPAHTGLLQRKCADSECPERRKKRLKLQRRSTGEDGLSEVSPIVHEVLRSPGEPPNSDTGEFAVSRFGHDFSKVRVHADDMPAISAPASSAYAHTAGIIQPKLTINQPGDKYEGEADRVAELVMRMPVPQSLVNSRPEGLSIQSSRCDFKKDIQPSQPRLPPIVHDVLSSPGRPLDPVTRAYMEPRFGHDFSRVRVHSDANAEQSAREVNANAYTVGHDIVFGAGLFAPGTHKGRHLLAHELTHVVQQSSPGIGTPAPLQIARRPKPGGGKPIIHPEAMAFLEGKMRQFFQLLSPKTRIWLKRNSTIAIGMATVDGEPRLVYTNANNAASPEIRAVADKLDLHRWTYETGVSGRGTVGAPNDAEQLMFEFARDNDAEMHGVVVSRRVCLDCGEVVSQYKQGAVPVSVIEDPIPVPRRPRPPRRVPSGMGGVAGEITVPQRGAVTPSGGGPSRAVTTTTGEITVPQRGAGAPASARPRGRLYAAAAVLLDIAAGLAFDYLVGRELREANEDAFRIHWKANVEPSIEREINRLYRQWVTDPTSIPRGKTYLVVRYGVGYELNENPAIYLLAGGPAELLKEVDFYSIRMSDSSINRFLWGESMRGFKYETFEASVDVTLTPGAYAAVHRIPLRWYLEHTHTHPFERDAFVLDYIAFAEENGLDELLADARAYREVLRNVPAWKPPIGGRCPAHHR